MGSVNKRVENIVGKGENAGYQHFFHVQQCFLKGFLLRVIAKPSSSVGSVQDLRTGGRWFDPRLRPISFRGLMIVIATGFIPLSSADHCFDDGYVGKQPVAWKEYCAEYW